MGDYSMTHAIVVALSLAFAGAESLAVGHFPAGAAASMLQRQVSASATLPSGGTQEHAVRFTRGREHWVVATCGRDCGSVTLRLFSPKGVELDRNATGSSSPEVAVIPAHTAAYRVAVTMERCAAEGCPYSIDVFSR